MKDILVIAHFTQVPGEKGNGRFHYIAEKIDKNNANVEIVTTSFSHRTKQQRSVTDEQLKNISYKLTMLYEPDYIKNVSLKRFYSHYIMGRSLYKYLKSRNKPDVIYCAVPSLDVAYVAARYAKMSKVKFIIDVQDLWPETFKMVFNIPVISNLIFMPMIRRVNDIYAQADEIIAVSKTYCLRALSVNSKCKTTHTVFLGTNLTDFDENVKKNKVKYKPTGEIWLAYCGTLGTSYDIITVLDSLVILKKEGIHNIKFVVMGDGPKRAQFEKYALNNDLNVQFTGRLPYDEMCGLLSACDITINPINGKSVASIINKHADYAASGLPVLNTQNSNEYRDLVDNYKMGFNCINGSVMDFTEKLKILINNKDLRLAMGNNARCCAKEKFDRANSYKEIIKLICGEK